MRVANPTAKRGEDIAAAFLTKKGYSIIERNYSKRYGEIDIIAIDQATLVCVEVKTRTSNAFGTPLESITPWKLEALIRTLEFYKMSHPKLPDALRIDAVSITLSNSGVAPSIELIQNISGF